MVEDKIKQIIINDRLTGIIGLDDAIKKTAEERKGKYWLWVKCRRRVKFANGLLMRITSKTIP